MSNQLVFHASVRDDVDRAYRWYQRERAGLGDEFLAIVEESLEFIRLNPTTYGVVHRGARAATLRRFPYVIYYREIGDLIEILAIQHGHRHSRTWRRRL